MSNQHKYTALRLFEFIRGILFSVIFIFVPKKKNRIIFNSSHNVYFNFNSKPLFLYFLEQLRKGEDFEIKYVTNCPQKLDELTKKYGNHFISNKNIFNMFYILRAKNWIISTNDLPVFGVFNKIGRRVHHLSHGTVFKNAGLLEKEVGLLKKIYYYLLKTNISYFYTSSNNLCPKIAEMYKVSVSRIKVLQHPRNEQLIKSVLNDDTESEKKRKILYAPTWRKNSESTFFPFADFDLSKLSQFLEENNLEMYLRLHPYFESELPKHLLQTKGINLLSAKDCPEINEIMNEFDIMISDYSSIFIDYLLLNRPLMFIAHDFDEFNNKTGFVFDYHTHTPGPKISTFAEFMDSISLALNDKTWYAKERSQIKERFHSKPPENALSSAYCEIIKFF